MSPTLSRILHAAFALSACVGWFADVRAQQPLTPIRATAAHRATRDRTSR